MIVNIDGKRVEMSETEAREYLDKDKPAKTPIELRQDKYGGWREQLDEIYHNFDAWKARIQSVKEEHPKE